MKSKKALEKENERLKSQLIDKKIKQHKDNYIHIPFTWKGIGRFLMFVGAGTLTVLNFLLIIITCKILELEDIKGFHQLLILYPIIGEYLLIGLTFICLTAWIKKGYNNIKNSKEGGMIIGLIIGLTFGLIIGLIIGLVGGLVGGSIIEFINGLIIGLTFGLIIGLIIGLTEEFKRGKK